MSRNKSNLEHAIGDIKTLREEFWKNVKVTGDQKTYNPELDKAGRVADFFELGELMMRDALERNESCGGHFREEYQTSEGEALRDDENFTFTSTWEFKGVDKAPVLHKEDLNFKIVTPTQRSYK
jgi:succinate dehydrogenase / fumarate reductase flavoprotein subunit